ncbi:amidohydrolase [Flavobacterium akiainvivens]|uniref:Omega-amidase YafV n=1 Tax=Flavobacterium akiainvivens TaxID=1202724 RepID=A0A0M9VIP3_9FLAO|nr:amidohydrolase [Flavobacterium akiainvivens]KOS06876.1 amidohydrolase [Flavobacterium akiainvivens]SFQ69387.1 Predicted amidohydrolase [Flavobacterium akiainvivens]
MKISLIQTALAWEDAAANRAAFTEKINAINEVVDLVVLPEMFATGFTMNPSAVAETMDGESVQWMVQTAVSKGCAITGSLVIEEDDKYYNRLLFVLPDGEIKTYNKRHLFSFAGEDKHYTAGTEKLIVDYKGWKICPLVCYDLRFPVFARNTEGYDLLLYVANWPQIRTFAWDSLLKARAIENLAYTIGVNRVGQDANGHAYSGHSQVLDALGAYIVEPQETDGVFTIELSKQMLEETRAKFAFLNDRDSFTLQY